MTDVSLAPGTVVTNRNRLWRVGALPYNALVVAWPEIRPLPGSGVSAGERDDRLVPGTRDPLTAPFYFAHPATARGTLRGAGGVILYPQNDWGTW